MRSTVFRVPDRTGQCPETQKTKRVAASRKISIKIAQPDGGCKAAIFDVYW